MHDESYEIRLDKKSFDVVKIGVVGAVSMENADKIRADLLQIVENESLRDVILDLAELNYFDSSGITVLMDLHEACKNHNNALKIVNMPPKMKMLTGDLDFRADDTAGVLKPRPQPNLFVQVGEGVEHLSRTFRDILVFVGAAVESLARDLRKPSQVRWDSLPRLLERCGTDATPIVMLLSFLMGGIMAFQAAIQLRKFGANIFVADLVGLSIVLEMGPLLTALIVAGRSGAAFAAQLGTMRVTEEIDALAVMGIDPMRYLVSPRIVAVALCLPCLTIIADIAGILGGCLVAGFSLDITPTGYFNQLHKVLEVTDVTKGLTKSFVFGIEIAMIGCLRGFQVRGGAEKVGLATTSAVVTGIFAITVTDAIFSVLYYYAPSIWK
ncbi:MAG: phospholipid/cholesterol/gamma-HCH transport system permease protein [Thermodesulfobacteriota bacterium]|nr:phospholipid/cholesterol/gamma-HCH transport system permease protein [Thermodesulfobacteriota bacterium]